MSRVHGQAGEGTERVCICLRVSAMNESPVWLSWFICISTYLKIPFLHTCEHAQCSQWVLPVAVDVLSSAVSPVVTSCPLHSNTFLMPVWVQLTWDFHTSAQSQAPSRDYPGRNPGDSSRTLTLTSHHNFMLSFDGLSVLVFSLFLPFLKEKGILIPCCEITCSWFYSAVQICLHNSLKKSCSKEPYIYHCSSRKSPYLFLINLDIISWH